MKANRIALIANTAFSLYNFRLGIIRALIASGYHVLIICPGGQYVEELRREGVEHHSLYVDRKGTNPISELRTLWQLYRVLRKERVDLVHTFTIKPNIYGSLAARAARTPVIINCVTGLGYVFVAAGGVKRWLLRAMVVYLYRFAFRFSRRVIFLNLDDFELFQEYKIVDSHKGMVMRGEGVDTEKFCGAGINADRVQALYQELGIASNQPQVIVTLISRLLWDKGIAEFVEAARVLKPKHPAALFLLVGPIDTGNPAAVPRQYVEQAEKEGLIKYLGERTDIPEILYISDVVTLPSFYREGIPRSLLEAMSMEKPIITTDSVGCREVVEVGKNGLVVPVKDPVALASAIERLVDDEELRIKMGKYGREKVLREFDERIIVGQTLKLYQELLGGKH